MSGDERGPSPVPRRIPRPVVVVAAAVLGLGGLGVSAGAALGGIGAAAASVETGGQEHADGHDAAREADTAAGRDTDR